MASIHKEGIEVLSTHIGNLDVVIVAPLNWGLGHATRCIPIIKYLLSKGIHVIIASDGVSLQLLVKEFPTLTSYELPSYGIRYSGQNMVLNLLLQAPSIIKAYFKERKAAKNIVNETKATAIISDNRFGFRTSETKNYYITHQLNILHSVHLISKVASYIHRYFIKKFDQCWIPDFTGERSLAGRLSSPAHIENALYLGPLTRIEYKKSILKWDVCIMLSGPEPQRTKLENALIETAPSWGEKQILWIRGTEKDNPNFKNITHYSTIINLADTKEIADALQSSGLLIARSGYTTVMDIARLDIKAIFIPTPGQTEQEYLARTLNHNPKYTWVAQSEVCNIKI